MLERKLIVCCTTLVLSAFCSAQADSAQKKTEIAKLNVVATGIQPGGVVPKDFTGDGADASPPLAWSVPPAGTQSIAVFCEDPDAPRGTWCHWIAYDFSPKTQKLAQGMPKTASLPGGAKQATNDFNAIGYNGPAPPLGKQHRYFFRVYGLSKKLNLPSTAKQADFRKAIEGAIVAEGYVMGTYKRTPMLPILSQ